MALSKFWLINGSKKTGKKSKKKVKKVSAKSFAKKVKKASVSVKRPVKKITKVIKEKVIVPEIMPATSYLPALSEKEKFSNSIKKMTTFLKSKKKGASKMAKKAKKAKKSIQVPKVTPKSKHRVTAYYKDGVLKTSRKAKIARSNYKINSLSTKGLINQIKPVAMLGGVSVASMIGINKAMDYIPVVKNLTGVSKSLSKVGVGVAGMIAAKKLIKNNTVANGILLGAVISAIADILATRNISVETVSGAKVSGNPALMYGRNLAPLGTPQYSGLNGIKVKGLNGYKLPAVAETMSGQQELY